jgi:hypothetical protein
MRTRSTVKAMSNTNSARISLYKSFTNILKHEGIGGLYIGYRVSIISNPTFFSIFFTVYEFSKSHLLPVFSSDDPLRRLKVETASSFTAGLLADVITNPLWIARLRIQTQVYSGHTNKYKTLF